MRHALIGKAILVLCAVSFGAALDASAQVGSVVVNKGYAYLQGSRGVILDPVSNNFGFDADVNGTAIGGITPPTVSGPINTTAVGAYHNNGVLVFSPADRGWRYGSTGGDFGTSSLALLDAAFGSGTYTFTVNGITVPLSLTGNAYPNAPVMTLTGGSWVNDRYLVDPSQPITITTNDFTAYGTHVDDLICIAAFVPGFTLPFANVAPFGCAWTQARQFASNVPGSKRLSYTIPANTLIPGQEYLVIAGFQAIVDRQPRAGLPNSANVATYSTYTSLILKAEQPVFPMQVTVTTTPTTYSAVANIQYRPQDVGTTGSVYVFALAPSTKVVNAAAEAGAHLGHYAKGTQKDAAVQCVLAQLNSSGQLQAVSAANLQAYVTGVLTSQAPPITILNNTLTANIAGATFFVGYGSSALSMVSSGVNRKALTVPGAIECDPQAPETGWWWNPVEGGRGYSIEASGNRLFFAAYLYDVSGRSTWTIAAGVTSLNGSLLQGKLESYAGGQSLTGAYRAPGPVSYLGDMTLAFNDKAHGTLIWPGGSVPIERFNIIPNGIGAQPATDSPQSGWWWNPDESGRGYFLEFQGDTLFMAGYMYDASGNPVWYLSSNASTNMQRYTNTWWQYANGQTLTGTFKPAQQINNNVGPVTIQFQGAETGIMTLPGGRAITIRRYRF